MTEIKLCRVEGCINQKPYKSTLCVMHRQRWYKYKSFELPKRFPEGTVTYCGLHGYLTKEQTYCHSKTKYGNPVYKCKKCKYQAVLKYRKINREKHLAQQRCYDSTNPKRRLSRFKERLKKFNITIEQYEEIYQKQNGLCAICKKDERRLNKSKKTKLCIDHCHRTGKVRGLLCWKCNALLGHADDSIEIIDSSKAYLKFHQE